MTGFQRQPSVRGQSDIGPDKRSGENRKGGRTQDLHIVLGSWRSNDGIH